MPNRLGGALVLAGLLWLGGCASEVPRHLVDFTPSASPSRLALSRAVTVELDSGYLRSVPAGTEFIEVGSTPQGTVYRPANTVFTIEGAHMHEAYPVVKGGRVVGFYLPVEKSFSPLSRPVEFPTNERGPSK